MAYALRLQGGTTQHVQIPAQRSMSGPFAYSYKFKSSAGNLSGSFFQILGLASTSRNMCQFADSLLSDTTLVHRARAVNSQIKAPISIMVEHEVRYEFDGVDQLKLYIDGELFHTFTGANRGFDTDIIYIGRHNNAYTPVGYDLLIYEINFEYGFTYNGKFDPSLSNGTGLTLTNSSGSNHGTLVGFSGDDSQWVYYDSGGGGTEQLITAGGTLTAVATAVLSAIAANAQGVSASGQVSAVATHTSSATAINAQGASGFGQLTGVATATSSAEPSNVQQVSASGSIIVLSDGVFSAVYVNEAAPSEIIEAGGILLSIASGSVSGNAVNGQGISAGGTVLTIGDAVFTASAINEQTVSAGGNVTTVVMAFGSAEYLEFDGIPDTSTPFMEVTGDWVDVYQQVGITVGQALVIQNTSNAPVFLSATATAPTNNTGLMVMPGQQVELAAGVVGLYAKALIQKGASITARDRASHAVLRPLVVDTAAQPAAAGATPEVHWHEATGEWQSVQALTGLPSGEPLVLQNIGSSVLHLAARNIKPNSLLDMVAYPGQLIEFNGPALLWVKSPSDKAVFTVQRHGHFQLLRPVGDFRYRYDA